jgi:hypothetical protein
VTEGAPLGQPARILRIFHSSIGVFELACLAYLWFCAIVRRRGHLLTFAVSVLTVEGAALLLAKGCPMGVLQRRVGDDAPMFELWFGPRLAPLAIPTFTVVAVAGMVAVVVRTRSRTDRRPAAGTWTDCPRQSS